MTLVSTIDTRRAEALTAFREAGLPHRRVEAWKYSDLRAVLDDDQVVHSAAATWTLDRVPEGVEFVDLSTLSAHWPDWVKNHLGAHGAIRVMDAAALAYAHGGLALRVTRPIAEPMRLDWSGHGHSRLLLLLDEGAALTLVETHKDSGGLRNVGADLVLAAHARLAHVRLADEAADSVQVESLSVTLGTHAEYRAHFANFGAKLSRVDAEIVLAGTGAAAHLSGVDVLADATHADVTTHVDHAVGDTKSTQLFKKVAGGNARSVYQGKVTVRARANGSDSRQTAKGLLLGERAEIDLKPELEILADDVKCAHGAAVGDLDTDSLFYLQSRGIPETEARSLLIHAFVADALEGIADETLRAEVRGRIEDALGKAGAA